MPLHSPDIIQDVRPEIVDTSLTLMSMTGHISNNPSFRLKHPGDPDSPDGSAGTSYPLTENYTLPVAQAMGRVA
jgi:hypothetical protein